MAPAAAKMLEEAVETAIVPETRSSYATAVKAFEEWCGCNNNPSPFPVDRFWLGAWLRFQAMFVKVSSLRVYMAGIRWQHEIALGYEWVLDGDPFIRKVMRFLKKRYGAASKCIKVPISLDLVLLMAKRLPGWPKLEKMSHDDRVFLTATVVGVLGFLRGGEFFASPKSSRPLLLHEQVGCVGNSVRVSVVRPKAQWYDSDVPVRCFTPAEDCPLDPVSLVSTMRELSPVRLARGTAAFRLASGQPLSKKFMLDRSAKLLTECGVVFTDKVGRPVRVRASSWRSGGGGDSSCRRY
jgi:hypothetical protein